MSLAPWGLEWEDDGIALHCSRLLRAAVVVVVVVVSVGRSVGVSFILFCRFSGSSKSEFVFDLEFVLKNYLKINLSFVYF